MAGTSDEGLTAALALSVVIGRSRSDSVVLADGTKDRAFTAGAVAMELYDGALQ